MGDGLACIASAAAGYAATFSDLGPSTPPYPYIVFVVTGLTTAVGIAWIVGPFPSERVSAAFVVFADLSISICLVLFASPSAALPGAALFTIAGTWATAFHGLRLLFTHLVWSIGTLAALFLGALLEPGTEIGIATGPFLLLLPVLIAGPLVMHSLLLSLRKDAERSFYDPLTGLRNRRGLDAAVAGMFETSLRSSDLGVLIIDIDLFKRLNDTHGHAAGDRALQLVAERVRAVTGSRGVTARIGGEEFVVVVAGAPAVVPSLARRLCETAHDPADESPVTVSIGVAHGHASRHDVASAVTALVARADRAMYTAKKRGGNQVVTD